MMKTIMKIPTEEMAKCFGRKNCVQDAGREKNVTNLISIQIHARISGVGKMVNAAFLLRLKSPQV